MKSKIKSLSRMEEEMWISFEIDNQIIDIIEKTFQEFNPEFSLSDYKKKIGEEVLEDIWELIIKDEDFNFTLILKKDYVRLKLRGSLGFRSKFLKILLKDAEFSELASKYKIKN